MFGKFRENNKNILISRPPGMYSCEKWSYLPTIIRAIHAVFRMTQCYEPKCVLVTCRLFYHLFFLSQELRIG